MRTIIFVAAALLVSGCGTEEGWVPGENRVPESPHLAAHIAPAPQVISQAPPPVARVPAPAPVMAAREPSPAAPVTSPPAAPVAPPPAATAPQVASAPEIASAPVPSTIDAHCRAVAHQRAADAHANGFSFKMTDIIYEGTYKDCVAWDAQHGPSVAQ